MWFNLLEAQFKENGIEADEIKCITVLNRLDNKAITIGEPCITYPPPRDKRDTIKQILLELGGRKPSELYA